MRGVSKQTVVVTGGAGFIGSNLCDRLIRHGHKVVCIDNLFTGTFENIQPLLNHPNFRFVEQDVRDPLKIFGPVERIYNLACPASPKHYQRDAIGTLRTCVVGACNVLELAREKDARVLQASTSEVYGDPETHPQTETYVGHVNPIGPRACYDEGKRAAETLFFDYRRTYGTRIKVARIFNTYGPRMLENDGRIVSNFIVQALRAEPITVYGDGTQTRSFCFVDDLIEGMVLLMESRDDVTGPCNLGNPDERSVREIATLVLDHTGSRSPVEYHPLPKDDPRRRQPSIALAGDLMGWRPRVALNKGLRATIDYFALKIATEEATVSRVPSSLRVGNASRAVPSRRARPMGTREVIQ